MRPKQRQAFDLLTLQLVERGYIRLGATDWLRSELLELLQRDAAAGLSRPGSWWAIHGLGLDMSNAVMPNWDRLTSGGCWSIQVSAPDFGPDELRCLVAAFDQEGERIYADDIGAEISWEGLDQALKWADDLAAQVGAGLEVA